MIQALIEFISIISIIIVPFIGLIFVCDGKSENNAKEIIIGLLLIVWAAVCLAVNIYAAGKFNDEPWQRDDPYVTHTVMALSDGNEVNGRLRGGRYCMSGYINEKFTYVYGYKTYGGGMKIQKAGADTTTIYFRDDIEPCAKWYKETKSFWWKSDTRYTCDIFVPTDSLQAGITIDLQ